MKIRHLVLILLAACVGLAGLSLGVFSVLGLVEVFQRKLTGGGPIGKASVAYPLLLIVSFFALRWSWDLVIKVRR
jgi:hypothetical protein